MSETRWADRSLKTERGREGRRTHPDVGPDVEVLTVPLQVPLDLLMGEEAAQLGVKGEVREHHHLFGQVGPEIRHAPKLRPPQPRETQGSKNNIKQCPHPQTGKPTWGLCTCCWAPGAHRGADQLSRRSTRCHRRCHWARTPPGGRSCWVERGCVGPHRVRPPLRQPPPPAAAPCSSHHDQRGALDSPGGQRMRVRSWTPELFTCWKQMRANPDPSDPKTRFVSPTTSDRLNLNFFTLIFLYSSLISFGQTELTQARCGSQVIS